MKLVLEETLPAGIKHTYTAESSQFENYPAPILRLLRVPGVKSLYHCLDFIALQRVSSADWQSVLSQAREILSDSGEGLGGHLPTTTPDPELGQVKIFIQSFRRIPLLVKVQGITSKVPEPVGSASDADMRPLADESRPVVVGEYRANLPPRFAAAVKAATPSSPNMLLERRWVLVEPRYGDLKDVGDAVAAEIDASYSEARVDALVKQAFEQGAESTDFKEARRYYTAEERKALLASSDWKQRYAAVESMGADAAHFGELAAAMRDPHISVRRMATIYLGLLKTPETLEPLVAALKDAAAVIRRTAGDALNDLADKRAIPAMIEALSDKNKLVRWRAARFLYELGDATALPALKNAAEAPEFEVKLQALQAIERIEGGKEAAGPIWMQMMRKR